MVERIEVSGSIDEKWDMSCSLSLLKDSAGGEDWKCRRRTALRGRGVGFQRSEALNSSRRGIILHGGENAVTVDLGRALTDKYFGLCPRQISSFRKILVSEIFYMILL